MATLVEGPVLTGFIRSPKMVDSGPGRLVVAGHECPVATGH